MNTENTKFKLSQNQVHTVFDKETVILNHLKGEYYALNEIGARVWALLKDNDMTVDQLTNHIIGDYNVSFDVLYNDIKMLLTNLIHEKLVNVVADTEASV